ncbi:hypothetical protein [Candidatus Nitrosocosmicus franklandus]|uniref:Uncharacterized protein n=1 Tax=Candidatus Nitrosocosmicus franklandianus TaxID=1798806 RepID=A0A484IIH8_9ARCH|nr:hypothetical protein [Candidatus Nitrosocosmicus franklandus]VFJ14698.1 protein of unknown function [Candidatus Nitrosocosmicus franklandus]
MPNHCNLSPIILSIFVVILLVINSTLSGIPSTIFFQNGVNEVTPNNLMTSYVFASPDEEADDTSNNNEDAGEDSQGVPKEEADDTSNNNEDAGEDSQGVPKEEADDTSNNNEDAGEDSQGVPEVAENITTVNPSLTALSEPPQNEQCPAGSPEGCYVKPSPLNARVSCQPGEMELKNVPGGPEGIMCAPIQSTQNQENSNNPIGEKEMLSQNNIPTLDESNSETTVTKSSPASCDSQGTLFDPITNMCKNPQSIQDCAKIMQRYDPNQGKCIRLF